MHVGQEYSFIKFNNKRDRSLIPNDDAEPNGKV